MNKEKSTSSPSVVRSDVAVLDKKKVVQLLPIVKKIRLSIEEKLKKCQQDFIQKEKDLRLEYQSILDEDAAPKDYEQALHVEEKRKQFKASVAEAQRSADTTRNKIQDAYDTVMSTIEQKLNLVIESFVKERHLECVLDRNAVVFCTQGKDLTKEVAERLIQETQEINFNL